MKRIIKTLTVLACLAACLALSPQVAQAQYFSVHVENNATQDGPYIGVGMYIVAHLVLEEPGNPGNSLHLDTVSLAVGNGGVPLVAVGSNGFFAGVIEYLDVGWPAIGTHTMDELLMNGYAEYEVKELSYGLCYPMMEGVLDEGGGVTWQVRGDFAMADYTLGTPAYWLEFGNNGSVAQDGGDPDPVTRIQQILDPD
ncbi:MAG: hypothetical protein AB1705_02750 [Verrucomicrobiota bacterium]